MVFRESLRPGAIFHDRAEAGERLAAMLARYRRRPATVVLGLPRGGVVPAAVIAEALELPLEVVISRKIGVPWNPELAMGAIAEQGEPYWNAEVFEIAEVSAEQAAAAAEQKRVEIEQRQKLFRGGRPLALPARATVILVDDGIATGSTAIAAIHALRSIGVERIVLAAGVAPPETVEVFRGLADDVVVVATPSPFGAVGTFYDEFRQVTDEQVCEVLDAAAAKGRRWPAAQAAAAQAEDS